MKNVQIGVIMFLLSAQTVFAQQGKILTSADVVSDVFGDKDNSITKAVVQTETDKMVTIQVEFKGFKDKDKSYKITGTMLNSKKMKIEEFGTVEVDLDPRAGLADLEFVFKQNLSKKYTTPTLDAAYVKFDVLDKKGVGASFGIEGLGIDSKTYTFNYKKKWKLKGAAGTEVTVKLTPFKSATTIKQ